MPTDFLSNETLAMGLAGIAAFAGVASLAMPGGRDARLTARLRLVAHERRQLRDRRLEELSSQTKARLRREANGLLKRLAAMKSLPLHGAADVTARLRMAGLRGDGPETAFLLLQAVFPVGCFALIFATAALWPGGKILLSLALQFALAAAFAGYGLPGLVLGRLIARRQAAIMRAFPDALDLLLICVQSGMSVEAALTRVTRDVSGQSVELAEEFSLTIAELAYLPSRWRAYHNLGERTGLPMVKMIAAALTQAERYGTSISQALTAAAKECREGQIAEAERKAAALPPKLTVPLVAFFLPVVMTVILAPAAIKTREVLQRSGGHLMERTDHQPGATTARNGRAHSPSREAADHLSPESGE